jgi:hypothetical protein
MKPVPDIAVLWRRPDGSSCVLTKRGTALVLTLRMFGNIQREQAVESPRQAMDLAKGWRDAEP